MGGLNDCDLARTTRSPQPPRYEDHHRRDQGWSIIERQRQIFSWRGSVTRAIRDGQCHFAAARICRWVRRFPPGPGRPPSSMISLRPSRIDALNARSLVETDRAPYPRRHRCPRPGSIESNRADPKPEVFFCSLRSVFFFLPPAHRGARVIGTDAMRIMLILREPSDGQEHKQDGEDNPNINAHQSSPAP